MLSQRRYIFLLLALVLLSPLGIDLFLPTLPQVAAGLTTSVSHIQLTIPLFLFVMGIGQLFSGPLVDNYGRRPIALIGILLYLLGSALAALSSEWLMFLLARIIQGLAVCCSAVVAFSGVRDRLTGDDAAKAYSFLNGSLNIVPALAPLLGGVLAHYFDWRAPFWFLFLYALILGVIVYRWLPETRPEDTESGSLLPLKTYLMILSQPQFLAFTFAIAMALGMVLTYVSLAPVVLIEHAGLSSIAFAIVFGANGLWIMAVSAGVNQIIRKVGRPFCLLAGCVAMLVAGGLLTLEPIILSETALNHAFSYMLPVAIAVSGLAFIMGPATSYALEPWKNNAGVASALLGFIQMAGAAGGSMLILLLPLSPYQALSIMMLMGGVFAALAWWTSRRCRGTLTRLD